VPLNDWFSWSSPVRRRAAAKRVLFDFAALNFPFAERVDLSYILRR
jgi:hypothetical protein